jgi:hypothetical protein
MPSVPWVPAFPQELYDLIIEMLRGDRPTLYNLCLVSHTFCFTAQRYLYRQVTLEGVKIEGKGRNKWSLNNIANNTFFSTLLQTHHLALHVRELYFRPDVGHGGENPWEPFHQALHEMINLKRLQLTLMTSDQTSSRLLEALGNHPFQLEVFSWVDYRFKAAANESGALISFLLSQPRLQALGILTKSISLILPEKSCPNLSTFIGTFAHALGVLYGHPVTNFVWTAPLGASPRAHTTVLLGALFTNLRVLVLRDHIPAELDRRTGLMNCFQSLEALHIYITPVDGYQPGLMCHLIVSGRISSLSTSGSNSVLGSYAVPTRPSCSKKVTHGCINRNNSR